MLPLPLVTLGFATAGAYATPTIRAIDGLEVSLSTPATKVASVSDLRIVATVRNVGHSDLKILKFGTVLDNMLPTRSFVVSKGGKETDFTGIKVRLTLDLARLFVVST
jgi:deuterolysin